jgi:hypothetical protein
VDSSHRRAGQRRHRHRIRVVLTLMTNWRQPITCE